MYKFLFTLILLVPPIQSCFFKPKLHKLQKTNFTAAKTGMDGPWNYIDPKKLKRQTATGTNKICGNYYNI